MFELSMGDMTDLDITTLVPTIFDELYSSLQSMSNAGEVTKYATAKHSTGQTFPILLKPLSQPSPAVHDSTTSVSNDCYVYRLDYLKLMGGMLSLNKSGYITSCNETFLQLMFGHGLDMVIGRHVSWLLPDFMQIAAAQTASPAPTSPRTDLPGTRETFVSAAGYGMDATPTSMQGVKEGAYEMTAAHQDGGAYTVVCKIRLIDHTTDTDTQASLTALVSTDMDWRPVYGLWLMPVNPQSTGWVGLEPKILPMDSIAEAIGPSMAMPNIFVRPASIIGSAVASSQSLCLPDFGQDMYTPGEPIMTGAFGQLVKAHCKSNQQLVCILR